MTVAADTLSRPDHPDRVVSLSRGLPVDMHQVELDPTRSLCYEVQQQASSVCFTTSRYPGLGSRCTEPVLGGSGSTCLPTSSHRGQSGDEAAELPMQENQSDCSRVAQHALVPGPSGHVKSNSTVTAQPANTAFQSVSSQESVKPISKCLAPRALAVKKQGFFSVALAA